MREKKKKKKKKKVKNKMSFAAVVIGALRVKTYNFRIQEFLKKKVKDKVFTKKIVYKRVSKIEFILST